jgi:hypothetical protein
VIPEQQCQESKLAKKQRGCGCDLRKLTQCVRYRYAEESSSAKHFGGVLMASPVVAAANLVEVDDPPLPSHSGPIQSRSAGEKAKNFSISLLMAIAFGSASWWLLHHGFTFYAISAGLVGLFAGVAAFFGSCEKAACPFCGATVDVLDRTEGRKIRCEKCSEYSTVNAGIIRPLDPVTNSAKPEFESPAFRNGIWPKGCVACGAPPVRLDDLSTTSVGGAALLVGALHIMRGAVKGVPYCAQHRDQLALKVSSDKKLILRWTSLRMMRRYLAVNRARPVS